MTVVSLVAHGIAGIATFHEIVATRILISNVIGLFFLLVALGAVIGIRLWTDRAIPGWATYATGLILVLFMQFLAVSFSLVFSLISNRSSTVFMPFRDYAVFVDAVHNMSSAG